VNLEDECRYLARQVLWKQGGSSSDVVETLAARFLGFAKEYEQYVREERESDDVIAHAVRYLADTHAIPPMGTDTGWFVTAMEVLMELAVPNKSITPEAAAVLPCLQQGIGQAIARAPITRDEMRIEDEDAEQLKRLEDAGCEWGLVSDLLDLLEKLQHGDMIDEGGRRLLRNAAMAAPLTRRARLDGGMDGS
jgi:hypothetical protein